MATDVVEVDVATGTVVERDFTAAELAQREADALVAAQAAQAETEAIGRRDAALAKLAALGLTVDDLTALGL